VAQKGTQLLTEDDFVLPNLIGAIVEKKNKEV
jgi:hypothetical protein